MDQIDGNYSDVVENARLARENALLGQYDTAMVYYQGVLQQIQKLMVNSKDPTKKQKWQTARQEIAKEYEYIKDINRTLGDFKRDNVNAPAQARGRYDDEPTRESRDPDVWPPPTPVDRNDRAGPSKPVSRPVGRNVRPSNDRNDRKSAGARPPARNERNDAGNKRPQAGGKGAAKKDEEKKEVKSKIDCGKNKKEEKAAKNENTFDPAGYDKDLVESLERDIVQKNPNVRWDQIIMEDIAHGFHSNYYHI